MIRLVDGKRGARNGALVGHGGRAVERLAQLVGVGVAERVAEVLADQRRQFDVVDVRPGREHHHEQLDVIGRGQYRPKEL